MIDPGTTITVPLDYKHLCPLADGREFYLRGLPRIDPRNHTRYYVVATDVDGNAVRIEWNWDESGACDWAQPIAITAITLIDQPLA